jgi:hypothetical protein
MIKSSIEYACSWWTSEDWRVCIDKHEWFADDKTIIKRQERWTKEKEESFRKSRSFSFMKSMHQATKDKQSIWKLMKWAKKHSYLSSESADYSSLTCWNKRDYNANYHKVWK